MNTHWGLQADKVAWKEADATHNNSVQVCVDKAAPTGFSERDQLPIKEESEDENAIDVFFCTEEEDGLWKGSLFSNC